MTLASLKRHIDRRFATKNDLRRFATKKDLRRFATKKDLERFATRDDMGKLETRMDARFGEMRRRFDSLNAKIDSVLDFARGRIEHHKSVLDEHENRLRDLEKEKAS